MDHFGFDTTCRKILLCGSVCFAVACTGSKAQTEPVMEEAVQAEVAPQVVEPYRVVERMGKLSETPKWAVGMEPMIEEKGDVTYVQTMTLEANVRPENCTRSAGEAGRSEFIRQIKDGVTAAAQVSEDSGSADIDIESTVAFLGNIKLNGLKVGDTFWEKIEEGDAGGKPVTKIRCAAKIAIARQQLVDQVRKATEANTKNPETRKKLLEGLKAFLEQISKEGSAPGVSEPGQ